MNDGRPETNRLYAWLTYDSSLGVEGIVTVYPHGCPIPLVTTDKNVALEFEERARRAAPGTARLVAFLRGEVIK